VKRFVDTNIFIYALTDHPSFGRAAKKILERIQKGESAMTSTLVFCEISWVLEAMGKQGDIKPTLEKIASYSTLEVVCCEENDLLIGAENMSTYRIDFNDGVNLALMMRMDISEVYSNDQKHLGKLDFLKLIFE